MTYWIIKDKYWTIWSPWVTITSGRFEGVFINFHYLILFSRYRMIYVGIKYKTSWKKRQEKKTVMKINLCHIPDCIWLSPRAKSCLSALLYVWTLQYKHYCEYTYKDWKNSKTVCLSHWDLRAAFFSYQQ